MRGAHLLADLVAGHRTAERTDHGGRIAAVTAAELVASRAADQRTDDGAGDADGPTEPLTGWMFETVPYCVP